MTPAENARRGRPPSGGREAMLTATLELVREKGAGRLTTRDVAERAGVSEGSVFYHFKDRAGLLTAVISDVVATMEGPPGGFAAPGTLRQVLDGFTTALDGFLDRALVAMVGAQADAQLRGAMADFLLANDLGTHRGVDGFAHAIRRLQENGHVRDDVEPRAAAYLVLSAVFQRAALRLMIGPQYDEKLPERSAVIDTLVTLLSV